MGDARQDQAIHLGAPAEQSGDGATSEPPAPSAFRAARQLLEEAEVEAATIVADAERRARAREREAELLVAKARRLLEAAEAKAAVIVAAARAAAPSLVDISDEALGRVVARDATVLPRGSLGARIDGIVASAVAQAVSEARPRSGALGTAS